MTNSKPFVDAELDSLAEASDSSAREGQKVINSGLSDEELKRLRQAEKHDRDTRFNWHLNRVFCLTVWIIFILIFLLGFCWLWNIIMPECWCWLKDARLTYVQSLVMGIGAGIISNTFLPYISQRISDD